MEVSLPGPWWAVVLLLLIGALYLYLTWNYNYWKKRGVPYVKPIPLFGNLKDGVFVKTMGEVLQDLYRELDGYKYGGIFKFRQPCLLLRDPETIKDILVKNFSSFHDNDLQVDVDIDPVFGRNPFLLHGERWKIVRSMLTPAFTGGKLKPYFPLIVEVCEELKGLIEKTGPEFETKELCARFTTDIVATCAFGVRGNALQDPNSEFRRIGRDIIEPDFWNNIRFMFLFFLPSLAKILKLGFISSKVQKTFSRIIKKVTSHRELNNIQRGDYLQYLMKLKKERSLANGTINNINDPKAFAPEKNIFTDVDIVAQSATFFTDGFETSSGTLAFGLYCLALHPDIQERVRDEVDSVIQRYEGKITFEAIQEMSYLDMALQESLRMYSPIMFMTRICTKPFKLETPGGGTYEVEVGTSVIIPLYGIHNDQKHHPDPKRYDPERFNEENSKIRHKYAFLPFGEGPRICLGMRFGLMQVKAGIASVIHNFEVRPNKKTPIPIVPDPNYLLLAAKGGLWLDFVKRKNK